MIHKRLTLTRYVAAALVGAVLLAALSTAEARSLTVMGIKVSYNREPWDVYYDGFDDTLTIIIGYAADGGNLKVAATKEAPLYWGWYCDVYVWADYAEIKNMSFKGIHRRGVSEFMLFICGFVDHARGLKVTSGCVGFTDYYGPDFGLYSYLGPPNKIAINKGFATAAVLGPEFLRSRATRSGKPSKEDVSKSETSPEDKVVFFKMLRAEEYESEEKVEPDSEVSEVEVSPEDKVTFWQMLLRSAKDSE